MRRAWAVFALATTLTLLTAAKLDWRASDAGLTGWWSVTDFGAVGDGVTDDCEAVQAAIDSAEVSGGTVYFPQGTYLCKCALTIDSHSVTLFGGAVADSVQYDRGAAILFKLALDDTFKAGLTIGARSDSSVENVRIRELGLFSGVQTWPGGDWTDNVSTMGHLIYACGVKHLIIENCQIDDSYGKADTGFAAVYLTADSAGVDSWDNTIEDCRIFANWAKSGGYEGHGLMLACNADNTENNGSKILDTHIKNLKPVLCGCRISESIGTGRDCDNHQFIGGSVEGFEGEGGGRVVVDGDYNVFQAYTIRNGHADSLALEFTEVSEDNIFEGWVRGTISDLQPVPEDRSWIQVASVNWPEHTELMMNLLRDWTPNFTFLSDSTGAAAIWYGNRDGGPEDTLFIYDLRDDQWEWIYWTN